MLPSQLHSGGRLIGQHKQLHILHIFWNRISQLDILWMWCLTVAKLAFQSNNIFSCIVFRSARIRWLCKAQLNLHTLHVQSAVTRFWGLNVPIKINDSLLFMLKRCPWSTEFNVTLYTIIKTLELCWNTSEYLKHCICIMQWFLCGKNLW